VANALKNFQYKIYTKYIILPTITICIQNSVVDQINSQNFIIVHIHRYKCFFNVLFYYILGYLF